MSRTHTNAPGDAVDRLADTYQQARLHKRRMHRCLSLAIAAGDPTATGAALVRFRDAVAWEERTRGRYLRAVLLEYAWLDHQPSIPDQPAAVAPVIAGEQAA